MVDTIPEDDLDWFAESRGYWPSTADGVCSHIDGHWCVTLRVTPLFKAGILAWLLMTSLSGATEHDGRANIDWARVFPWQEYTYREHFVWVPNIGRLARPLSCGWVVVVCSQHALSLDLCSVERKEPSYRLCLRSHRHWTRDTDTVQNMA